jgi:hypothetical protein
VSDRISNPGGKTVKILNILSTKNNILFLGLRLLREAGTEKHHQQVQPEVLCGRLPYPRRQAERHQRGGAQESHRGGSLFSMVLSSVVVPEPRAKEPKLNGLLKLEPKLRIAAPAPAAVPFH